jgi:hypothetical protein
MVTRATEAYLGAYRDFNGVRLFFEREMYDFSPMGRNPMKVLFKSCRRY